MLRIGLTGGMGAGKSTVAGRLAEHGAVVIDADRIAREVVEPGTDGLAEIIAEFGDRVLAGDGSLDRAALGGIVFQDEAARLRLNAIVHPRVGARTAELIEAAPADAIVVYDVPLLVENGLAPGFHLTIVVHAPVEERVRRLVTSRGVPEQDARARIAAQATDEQRLAVADVWLDNTGSPDLLMPVIDALWTDRLVPFEANVRLRRRAERGSAHIVDYRPDWPRRAERLINRIRAVAGERALRVDHIGSTSVPGLAAKDVIDLQLTVAAIETADELAAPLTEAGFAPVPWADRDNPKPTDPDVTRWQKRLHSSSDPGLAANLHIRVAGMPNQRFALLFRDWLRAVPAERVAYEQLKRELAERLAGEPTTREYALSKEPWFDQAFERANLWAEDSGWSPV
ncbi:dephospho-CoA kinase [Crossiella sp. SN42]|uniref:dephospho-CoA kinase n=1 Tax=Crossiella sp. SN42 TaxID=2944808 RepID=UPI00207CFEF2|nr:dephospho-CoA kinase [Crossiella sp. SN42]MCO1579888.1 dephospho-CoA kinase [Crossiella sp. SN42]